GVKMIENKVLFLEGLLIFLAQALLFAVCFSAPTSNLGFLVVKEYVNGTRTSMPIVRYLGLFGTCTSGRSQWASLSLISTLSHTDRNTLSPHSPGCDCDAAIFGYDFSVSVSPCLVEIHWA
ncbi:uncharacterized protein EI90DRAFT_3030922, partial [Cantharellus anzutake]|uniref:uncharacterized protein n=1 Tax=Cantharellus anzutake TaxID=1750568 RepID=UPI001906A2F6